MNAARSSILRIVDVPPGAADRLASRLPYRASGPFLLASGVIAAAYGTSFVLPEYVETLGMERDVAGSMISSGMVATIVCCCLAGRLAQRIGIMQTMAAACLVMALAMAAFAAAVFDARIAYLGGMLVGVGWSGLFILSPLQIIRHLRPTARIQHLAILSGAQMAGLGLAAPLGHFLAEYTGSMAIMYALFAMACAIAAICIGVARNAMLSIPSVPMPHIEITLTTTIALLRHATAAPILMIAVAACIFSGLSTYQSAYAASRDLNPDLFFLVFTITSVALRFSVAHTLNRVPVHRLALTLFIATGASLTLLFVNSGDELLYILAAAIFATGYGLSYSTLNGMAVNLAGERGLSVPVTSQIFTLAYFLGLFGFPFLGGQLIREFGLEAMLLTLLGATAFNGVLATALRPKAGTGSL
ncbi:MFS transporter [Bradyrhizobium sp. Ec3.3]|uniref:MFS transporter n=1 Tax=Bradyrhizobium sp. Ec3.3 TaxID=189753 RepID=UPI0004295D54|nr:MFS transporter [Bradyrhizobium sp. Ec3.3]